MKPRLAHALSVGIRGEASLRVLQARRCETSNQAIVDTVLNPDQAGSASNRRALNGFRPDAYSLVLECSGQQDVLPLSNCLLLTERGGLDQSAFRPGHSVDARRRGWRSSIQSISRARRELNRRLLDPQQAPGAAGKPHARANATSTGRYSLRAPLRLIEGQRHCSRPHAIGHRSLSGSACDHLRSIRTLDDDETSTKPSSTLATYRHRHQPAPEPRSIAQGDHR